MRGQGWVVVGFLAIGCMHQPLDEIIPDCSAPPSFDLTIKPVVNTKCGYLGCHDGSNGKIPRLVTLEEIQNNAADIAFQLSHDAMPPSGSVPLTAKEKAIVLCWINQGAKGP